MDKRTKWALGATAFAGGVVGSLVLNLLIFAIKPVMADELKTITAQELTITDAQGKTRVKIDANGIKLLDDKDNGRAVLMLSGAKQQLKSPDKAGTYLGPEGMVFADDKDNMRAVLGLVDGTPEMYMLDKKGNLRIALNLSAGDTPAILLGDEKKAVSLRLSDDGNPVIAMGEKDKRIMTLYADHLQFWDEDKAFPKVTMGLWGDGHSGISFQGDNGKYAGMRLTKEGFPEVVLDGDSSKINMSAGASSKIELEGPAGIYLDDTKGKTRTRLELTEGDNPIFSLWDGNGKIRTAISLAADGTPGIKLSDVKGDLRASLFLSADSSPGLDLLDSNGKRRVMIGLTDNGAPAIDLRDDKDKGRAFFFLKPDGSPIIRLLDDNDRSLWSAP